MTINPSNLTIKTAVEARRSPPDEKCAICQELLEDAPPEYSPIDGDENDTDHNREVQAVTTKVCGDKHFFHRICIESWWKSADAHLNTCPVDRALCYGIKRIGQTAVNLPKYVGFIGHNPHAQSFLRPPSFRQWLLASHLHSNMGNDDPEDLDDDEDDADSDAMPGRETEDVQAPFAMDPDHIDVLEGLVEIVANGLNRQRDRPVRNDG